MNHQDNGPLPVLEVMCAGIIEAWTQNTSVVNRSNWVFCAFIWFRIILCFCGGGDRCGCGHCAKIGGGGQRGCQVTRGEKMGAGQGVRLCPGTDQLCLFWSLDSKRGKD